MTKILTSTNATPVQPINAATPLLAKPVPTPRNHKSAVAFKARKARAPKLSKQDRVLGMLRRKEGTSVPAIMKATGWQQHSVRGFLAGVVRKKLKLNLTARDDGNGKRIYRIASGKLPKSASRTAR